MDKKKCKCNDLKLLYSLIGMITVISISIFVYLSNVKFHYVNNYTDQKTYNSQQNQDLSQSIIDKAVQGSKKIVIEGNVEANATKSFAVKVPEGLYSISIKSREKAYRWALRDNNRFILNNSPYDQNDYVFGYYAESYKPITLDFENQNNLQNSFVLEMSQVAIEKLKDIEFINNPES